MSIEREIYDLVRAAINSGVCVIDVKKMLAEAWDAELHDKRNSDAKEWSRG